MGLIDKKSKPGGMDACGAVMAPIMGEMAPLLLLPPLLNVAAVGVSGEAVMELTVVVVVVVVVTMGGEPLGTAP
jgi:hypothetical protein